MSSPLLQRFIYLAGASALVLGTITGCDGNRDAPPVTIAGSERVPTRAAVPKPAEEKDPVALEEPGEGERDPLGPGTEEQQVKLTLAKAAFLTDQYELAEQLFLELIAMEPISAATVSGAIALGQIYMETDRRGKALELYEGFARRAGDIAELNLVLARTYAAIGESQKALEGYEKALALEPEFVFVLPEIGALHAQAGRQEDAAAAFYRYEQRIYALAKKLENFSTPDQERLQIVDTFSFLHDDRATEALIKALQDPHPRIRLAAVVALGELNVTAARGALETSAVDDGDMQVRMAARGALEGLRDEPSGVVDPIRPTVVQDEKDLPQ